MNVKKINLSDLLEKVCETAHHDYEEVLSWMRDGWDSGIYNVEERFLGFMLSGLSSIKLLGWLGT